MKCMVGLGACLGILLLVSAPVGASDAQAVGDPPFAAAEAALAEARRLELVASEDYDSYQMAHAAAREIARAERQRVERELKRVRAAQAALDAAAAANKQSELAGLQQELAARMRTLRTSIDRMLEDSRISTKASEDVIAADVDIRAKQAAARQTERELLEAKAVAAEKSGTTEGTTARLAVRQLDLLCGMEAHQWPYLRRLWIEDFIEHLTTTAAAATAASSVETDPGRKTKLEEFVQEQLAKKPAAEKLIAELQQEEAAAEPRLYPLRAAASGGLELLPPEQWDAAKARHLLVRAGFGGTPEEVAKLHAMGLYKAVDHLVEYYRRPAVAVAFDPLPPLRSDPLHERMTVRTMKDRVVGQRRSVERGQVAALRQAWLRRMVESPRPLQEKLALFWHGLFASQDSVVQNSHALHRQIQLFREHAGGNYAAMLYGIVHDPAMLRYLDNNQNVKGQPNENLAREILELFSMGVDQGYTEHDIVEAARALTGYTYDEATGAFQYQDALHDHTDKTIFGQTGNWTGDDLVRLILARPETSRFVARRLFEYFAHEDAEPETIDALATVLRVHDYDLEPLLKNLFMSKEFYSPHTMGAQIKSPVELVVGLLRDLGVKQGANYGAIDGYVQQMGMQLLEPPDVKGWRYGRPWINSQRLFSRYNASAALARSVCQPANAQGVDLLKFVQNGKCENGEQVVDYLARACLIQPLRAEQRQELVAYLGELPPCSDWTSQCDQLRPRLVALAVLLLSTPEYQML